MCNDCEWHTQSTEGLIMESKLHKQIANHLASLKNTEYHSDKGVDIRTNTQAIEVEVDINTFGQASRQLAGTTKTPYLAVPKTLVKPAIEYMEGKRFGVMDQSGKIYKRGIGRGKK